MFGLEGMRTAGKLAASHGGVTGCGKIYSGRSNPYSRVEVTPRAIMFALTRRWRKPDSDPRSLVETNR
jgi:hypothetical protein